MLPAEHDPTRPLWAARAWLPGPQGGGWQQAVLLQPGRDGRWAAVEAGVAEPPAGAQRLAGPVLPGLVDAHSHAFQRAFAGLAERREGAHDDFWGWRDRMYRVALRITPAQLAAVAAHLDVELLRGGYTQVCEFHYLQHAPDGRPYDDPLAFGWALADAAAEAGIGLTLLPAVYERAGFEQPALRPDQRRFALDADAAWQACRRVHEARRPGLQAGVALHSLRAARPAAVQRLRALVGDEDVPLHVHVAEQTAEVDDCLAATGRRPIEWLLAEARPDARWQLVHATHAEAFEIDGVAASGAGVVLCPTTEANLGDGLTDVPHWLAAGVPLAIGSDSQVTRGWREELRLLEYGQRLLHRRRNVCAAPEAGQPSSPARLWSRVAAHGRAAGQACWGLQRGARADLLVVDLDDASLVGLPPQHVLDTLVMSSPGRPWRDVMVAGRWVVQAHRHPHAAAIAARAADALQALWADPPADDAP